MGDTYNPKFVKKSDGSIDVNIPAEAFNAAKIPGQRQVCKYITESLAKFVNKPGDTKLICWAVLQDRYRTLSPEFEQCRKCYHDFYPDDPKMKKFDEFLSKHV